MTDPIYPRILVLILASDTEPLYCMFQTLWRQYMDLHPNIDAYFYKGHPNLVQEAFMSDNKTLLVKSEEGIINSYKKTLMAFDFFSSKMNNYDFVFRTNLSSFIVFKHYLEFWKKLPKKNCCAAFIGKTHDDIIFPAGAGFTLTPDLVLRILNERPPLIVDDDVTIGAALMKWGIPIIDAKRIDFLLNDHINYVDQISADNPDIYHYRLKNLEGNRTQDIIIFQKLLKKYYNRG